jgi:hypothetical protein
MSTIAAKETDCNHGPDGRTPVCVPPANRTCGGKDTPPMHLGRRRMRVKLCSRCPYVPRDLADHYDPEGILHVCAKCDGRQEASTNSYPRKANRRQQCATVPNISATTQPSVARSAMESLVSSGTTPGAPPSVQRSALTASRRARMLIADGCFDFTPPDDGSPTPTAFLRSSGFPSREFSQ